MVGADINYQFIDWAHPKIINDNGDPELDGDTEVGEHIGTLSAYVVNPSITIGLSDYWNTTFSQVIGIRDMTWGNERESVHHRPETSNSDFINARDFFRTKKYFGTSFELAGPLTSIIGYVRPL